MNFFETNKNFTNDQIELLKQHAANSFNEVEDDSSPNLWYSSVDSQLSDKQKELLGDLDVIINDENATVNQTLASFDVIKERAVKECTGSESKVVLAAIEIGRNSLVYWNENLDQWLSSITITSSSNAQGRGWFGWKKLVRDDIKGAVSGAVGGAISGAGAGIGALGGGLAASAGNAIVQVWNHIFG